MITHLKASPKPWKLTIDPGRDGREEEVARLLDCNVFETVEQSRTFGEILGGRLARQLLQIAQRYDIARWESAADESLSKILMIHEPMELLTCQWSSCCGRCCNMFDLSQVLAGSQNLEP